MNVKIFYISVVWKHLWFLLGQSVTYCWLSFGLSPPFIMEGNTKLQLQVHENEVVIFFPCSSSQTSWILSADPLGVWTRIRTPGRKILLFPIWDSGFQAFSKLIFIWNTITQNGRDAFWPERAEAPVTKAFLKNPMIYLLVFLTLTSCLLYDRCFLNAPEIWIYVILITVI